MFGFHREKVEEWDLLRCYQADMRKLDKEKEILKLKIKEFKKKDNYYKKYCKKIDKDGIPVESLFL